jgi:hypothetical protein
MPSCCTTKRYNEGAIMTLAEIAELTESVPERVRRFISHEDIKAVLEMDLAPEHVSAYLTSRALMYSNSRPARVRLDGYCVY